MILSIRKFPLGANGEPMFLNGNGERSPDTGAGRATKHRRAWPKFLPSGRCLRHFALVATLQPGATTCRTLNRLTQCNARQSRTHRGGQRLRLTARQCAQQIYLCSIHKHHRTRLVIITIYHVNMPQLFKYTLLTGKLYCIFTDFPRDTSTTFV